MTDENSDIRKVIDNLAEMLDSYEDRLDLLASNCDPEMKLAVTRWVMKNIVEHARDGGSYRYLIYERLGFGPEAYAPLCSDGITISNEFDLDLKDNLIEALQKNDMEKMKSILGCCDVEGCFKHVTSGWPDEDGKYRLTCSNHYKGIMKNV